MNILAIVLAGGEGRRLRPLTETVAKPALTVAGGCRLIDFALSNLRNSGIERICVVLQYQPQSVLDHLNDAWDERDRSGRRIVEPLLPDPDDSNGVLRGTVDAVRRCADLIRAEQPDLVAVFAADHVYRMDVRQMAAFHQSRRADVTIGAVPVPRADGSRFGVIAAGPDGQISAFDEKPAHPGAMAGDPGSALASMGNYLFRTDLLLALIEEAHARGDTDIGQHICPRLPGRYRTFAYDLRGNIVPGLGLGEQPGYWRDVGTLAALEETRIELNGLFPLFRLWNADWPVRTGSSLRQRLPPRDDTGAFPPDGDARGLAGQPDRRRHARPERMDHAGAR